jgi:hypothetical protein
VNVSELIKALEEYDDHLEVEVHNKHTGVSYMTDDVEYGHEGHLDWVTVNFSVSL